MISVIVPVYKVEKYLRRCVDSIFAQTFADFELLLVDDGSPDNSGKICDEYAALDPRVRVFHKPNGGVSSARNLGLENARGEWISFIDSDDWVDRTYLEKLMQGKEADLSVCSFKLENTDEVWPDELESKLWHAEEVKDLLLTRMHRTQAYISAPWCKLFRRDIIEIHRLRFDESLNTREDTIFSFQYLSYINDIYTVSDRIYHYDRSVGNLSSNTGLVLVRDMRIVKALGVALLEITLKHNLPDWGFLISTLYPFYKMVCDGIMQEYTKNTHFPKCMEEFYSMEAVRVILADRKYTDLGFKGRLINKVALRRRFGLLRFLLKHVSI